MGKTTIKSTMIIDEFVHHPGSGRATDYQNDVATCRSPSIPEVLQGRYKVRAHSIHPRQFVEKNHLAFYLGQRIEIRNQHLKGIEPIMGQRRYFPVITTKCIKEIFQLFQSVSSCQSGCLKNHFLLKIFTHEKRFPHSAASAYSHKFRLPRLIYASQCILFTLSTYYIVLHFLFSCFNFLSLTKIARKSNYWLYLTQF